MEKVCAGKLSFRTAQLVVKNISTSKLSNESGVGIWFSQFIGRARSHTCQQSRSNVYSTL